MPLKGKDAVKAKIREKGDKLVRAVILDSLATGIRMTRVDTARLRNNWNVQSGKIDRGTTNDPSYSKNGAQALKAGLGEVARIRAGGSVFVTNSLVYADPILGENGDNVIKILAARMRKLVAKVAAKLARE